MMNFDAEIERLRGLVEEALPGFLPACERPAVTLGDAMRYTLALPGKRVRPVLLLLAYEAAGGGDEGEALPYACAVEYIHNYSLIHDDLPAMDDDDLRRGQPTNHKVFGEAMAILAGGGLLSAAFEAMHGECGGVVDSGELRVESGGADLLARRVRAGAAIARGSFLMVKGQAADIEAEGGVVSCDDAGLLEFIHENKTAALIRAAVEAGAWLGGAGDACVRAFAEYGENLGLAFQVADDILDVCADTAVLGKTAGKDAKAGKLTYAGLYGVDAARERLAGLTEGAAEALAGAEGADVAYIEMLAEMARGLERRAK
ncbi:MAG: polyprenyl synthetase family protein [Clostridiales bacterium]|nr:polyprenyl synthetase family protein [Clostridiales bacterium]